jgi:hypothetical protein
MADGMSAADAAAALGTTAVTVRKLCERGRLAGTKEPWGSSRFRWAIDPKSVDKFAREGGVRKPRRLDDRLAALETDVTALKSERGVAPGDQQLSAERDDLRARVVTLEEALLRMRAASELQREAADARAKVVSHLLEAAAANESAEDLYRRALGELEEALASTARPGHPGRG